MSISRPSVRTLGLLACLIICVIALSSAAFVGGGGGGTPPDHPGRRGVRISRELVFLSHTLRRCDHHNTPEVCQASIAESFPGLEGSSGLVFVSFHTRTDIDEADVQEWLATLPEDLFIFVDLKVPRTRITLQRGPDRQPPTVLLGWADARRIFELRKYLREWVDDGLLNAETYPESYFTGDDFVATQTWLLTNAPRDPGTATECVDPKRHHAYFARYLPATLANDVFELYETLPPMADVNPVTLSTTPSSILLTTEHVCARLAPGTTNLCDSYHSNAPPDPLNSGLVRMWEGGAVSGIYHVDRGELPDEVRDLLDQYAPLFSGIQIMASQPLIGYRDGARFRAEKRAFNEYVHLQLRYPVYVFPDDERTDLIVDVCDAQYPPCEDYYFRFHVNQAKTKWTVYSELGAMLTRSSEELTGQAAAIPLDEAIEVFYEGARNTWAFIDTNYVDPGNPSVADQYEALSNNVPGNGLPFLDDLNQLMASDAELAAPFLGEWIGGVGATTSSEWAEGIGPFLGEYAFEMNNRIGGDNQHGSPDWTGIVGLGLAQDMGAGTWTETEGCDRTFLEDAEDLDWTDEGLVVMIRGFDQYFTPDPDSDEITSYEGENVGRAWWTTLSADDIATLPGVQELQDIDLDPTNHPFRDQGIVDFVENLLISAFMTGTSSIWDDYCEDRWAARGELDACNQMCEANLTGQDLTACMIGCSGYVSEVEAAWQTDDGGGACAEPDYLYVNQYLDTTYCFNLVKSSLQFGAADFTMEDHPVIWTTEPPPFPTGCSCSGKSNTDDGLETYYQMITYRPPVYLDEGGDGRVEIHVPLGVAMVIPEFEIDIEFNLTENQCPVVPVHDSFYTEAEDERQVAINDGDADEAARLQSWLNTHVPRSEAGDLHLALEEVQSTFLWGDANQSTQHIGGEIVVYLTVEWVFPLEMERHWEWATLFYAENAFPAATTEPRTEGRLSISFDHISFFLDQNLSEIEPVGGLTEAVVVSLIEERLGDAHDNTISREVSKVMRQQSGSVPEVSFVHVRPLEIDSARTLWEDPGGEDEERRKLLMSHAIADYGGNPISAAEAWLPYDKVVPPSELRAVMYDDPLHDWLLAILVDLAPEELLIFPRWRVMHEAWEEVLSVYGGDRPGSPWDRYIAAHDSTIEWYETPVTDINGIPVAESATWPSSSGVAGFLLFKPTFPSQNLPQEWYDITAPPSWDLTGAGAYSGTDPWWNLPMEDIDTYRGWEPGLP